MKDFLANISVSLPRPMIGYGQCGINGERRTDDAKRISDPGIFPAYFRYELPEAIFSSVEMDALLRRMGAANNADDREHAFFESLNSMEKGSLRRDDFLRKLADAATKSMPLPIGKALVHATMKAADKYTYDVFPTFGEAGHVLVIALRILLRLQRREKLNALTNASRMLRTIRWHIVSSPSSGSARGF